MTETLNKTEPVRISVPRFACGAIGSAIVLFASLAGPSLQPTTRAWLLVGGFLLLTGACVGASRRFVMPAILGVILVVFCGLSATVAVPEPLEKLAARAATLSQEDIEASTPRAGFKIITSEESFRYAGMVTGLGGLAAMLAALLAAALVAAPDRRLQRRPGRIERTGKILVLVGFIGVAGALIRFGVTQFPVENLWDSFKSFWIGGTFLLVIATFAVPGFALWVQGLVGRSAQRREYLLPALCAALFVALLIPTGQRGFLIALAVMLLAILLGNRIIGLRITAALVVAGVVFIGATQAIRNEASGVNQITLGGFIERVQPDQWKDLYSSQIASFNWTILVDQNRDRLDIDNSFVQLLAKPVPRSIYPEKSQGFGAEFTRRMFPNATKQNVSFATPLVSEADYNFGPVGVVIILALLGSAAVVVDRRIAQKAPSLVEPVVAATVFWVIFEIVRGDLANALVFSAGWVIPLVICSRAIGLRRDPALKKVVIDALQAAPRFSGIGRRLADIGASLSADPLELPVEVRCPRDVEAELRACFPLNTTFATPLASSRPRVRRILYQQIFAPFLNGPSTLLVCPGDQAPVWGRSPLLFVVHDVRRLAARETARGRLEATYYRRVMKGGAGRASQILTISEFSRTELIEHLKPRCPVSIVAEQPRDIELVPSEKIEGNPPDFLLVGALRGYKGIETAIDALGDSSETGDSGAAIVCVGDSEGDPGYVERIARLATEADGRFRMTGWISDEELRALYEACCGTVNPSTYEGYGLSVAESLAAGLPTIASDIPPHREIGGDAVLYFEPGDAGSLAGLMLRLSRDPARRAEMALASRRRHLELLATDRPWALALGESIGEISDLR